MSNAKRRPTANQIGAKMETVPWSAERFQDLRVVGDGIAAEIDASAPGRRQDMLRVLLRIARGEWPRPTYHEAESGLNLTSILMLAQLAGMSKYFAYDDVEVVAALDKWLPRLADAPGYPVRVVDRQPSLKHPTLPAVMLALDRAEREGRQIPRAFTHGASIIGFCELNGLSIQEVRAHQLSVRQITDAAKRPGALGETWEPLFKGPELEEDIERVLEWLQTEYDAKAPLPGRPDMPFIVDYEYIEQQAQIQGRSVTQTTAVQAHVRRHREAFGVEPRKVIEAPARSCSEFKAQARAWFVAENGETGSANVMTSLNRVFAARQLTLDAAFPKDLFDDLPSLEKDAAKVEPPLKVTRNLTAHLRHLAEYGRRFTCDIGDGLPASAHEALDFAMTRWGGKITDLEKATGIPAALLTNLRSGGKAIPQRYVKCLPALDRTLDTGDGLLRRFEPGASFRLCDCSKLYRSLSSNIRNLLPKGAHKLADEHLLPLVREVDENAVRQKRMYTKFLVASKEFWSTIPDLPGDAPMLEEVRLLLRHKRMAVPDDGRRRGKGAWSKASRDIQETRLRKFGRFAMLERSRGGLGLAPDDVSLALLLNWRVLVSFMEFLARRCESVEHEGVRRGPLLTVADTGFLELAKSLLHERYGWVQQRKDIFASRIKMLSGALGPFPGLEELRIRHSGDDDIEMEEIEELLCPSSKMFRSVMPAEIVEAAQSDWFNACVDGRDKIDNLQAYLLGLVDPSRDPFEPIQVIVDSKKPLNYLRDIAQAAQDDLPDIAIDPVGHAIAVRNLLMFVLLSVTALRSKNLRQLLYDPNGRGHITVQDDKLHIKIPWENFKNMGSWHLFGLPGFKFDYEKMVSDWFNVRALFDHYVGKCRPLLIGHYAKQLKVAALRGKRSVEGLRTNTNALFPTPSLTLMNEHDFGDIVRGMTRRYHVLDPKTGLVRPGYMFFGPHAVRDIVASHIVNGSKDPSRWEEAADLLQTSIAMVKLRYTKRKVIDRLAISDRHFDEVNVAFRARAFA